MVEHRMRLITCCIETGEIDHVWKTLINNGKAMFTGILDPHVHYKLFIYNFSLNNHIADSWMIPWPVQTSHLDDLIQ